MKIELNQYIMREPTVGTKRDIWFANIVSKTTYPFFYFNEQVFAVSRDRETYLAIDIPYEILQSLKRKIVI